jgi:Zn-dependent M28 family amino/carboxypeptidase
MTFFGEERGLVGSRYYGAHPIFPIEKTVADMNLEQVGRTDDTEGAQVMAAAVTGFDFSDVGTILQKAGEMTGVKIFKHPTNSDRYFGASDNQALADQGVPAHTVSVAYQYPDYHKVSDHWDKVDYENMAKIDRTIALAITTIANNPQEPKWNEANPKTAKYVKAWKDRRGK